MLENIIALFSNETSLMLTLIFFTAVIVIATVFISYFCKFLAKKNFIELNLNQYNQYSNPTLVKIFAVILYIIEYIILLPIMTFFWFAVLSILILLLARGLEVSTILLISSALVASVRITSYVSENLSEDLAKLLPFNLMAFAITATGFFDISDLLQRIYEIPSLFSSIPYYLLFIMAVEFIMRISDFIQSVFDVSRAEQISPSEKHSW